MLNKKTNKKILWAILLVCICLLPMFAFCSCQNNLGDISKNLTNYNISVTFNDENKTLTGSESVDYVNNTDIVLDKLCFHLYPNSFKQGAKSKVVSGANFEKAYINGFSEGKIEINGVKVNKENIIAKITGDDDNILEVALVDPIYPDDRVQIDIDFIVTMPNICHRFGYGDNTYNFGNFYPICCKYEDGDFRKDVYSSNGDPFYSDIANYSVTITNDKKFVLACSGTKKSEETKSDTTTTKIVSNVTRDFAFVLSEKFSVLEAYCGKTKVFYYYFDDENCNENLKAGVDAISTFSSLFGEYPYETYSIVKADFVHGGMEYPTLVYISSDVKDKAEYINVIVHETAHQWWYGLIGSDEIRHAWMDEGLSEYSTILFYKNNKNYGVNAEESLAGSLSNYLLFSRIYESVYGQFDSSMDRDLYHFTGDMEYTYVTYVKGVLFFDNLCETVGEKAFLKSLKYYYKQNVYKVATKEDMIGAFETVTHRGLENFFSSWLDGKVILQQT